MSPEWKGGSGTALQGPCAGCFSLRERKVCKLPLPNGEHHDGTTVSPANTVAVDTRRRGHPNMYRSHHILRTKRTRRSAKHNSLLPHLTYD